VVAPEGHKTLRAALHAALDGRRPAPAIAA
jgi:hypothetical protein